MQTPATADDSVARNKNVVLVIYVLYALAVVTGISSVAGVIVAYIKRDDVQGTWLASHIVWQIKTFWWGLALSLVSLILMLVAIGVLMWFVVACWLIYRVAKGWLRLNDNREVT
jgi:uncharacterized membrane protein